MTRPWDLKYRPQTYEEVLGNKAAVQQLQSAPVKSYVFHGPSGTGKTSLVRIFAKQIKAEVIELDATSIGKADIEDLKNNATHLSMFNPYKVIILDESHSLSKAAAEALLKVIEEGPATTIWAMCTTELHKVVPALQSRSRIIELKRSSSEEIEDHLKYILKIEDKEVDLDKLQEIIAYSDGQVRQAVKLTETLATTGEVDLPISQRDAILLLKAVYDNDADKIVSYTKEMNNEGIYVLIRTISEYMTAFTLMENRGMEDSLRDNTSLSTNLISELRELTISIEMTLKTPHDRGKVQIINRLFTLQEILMRHYNNFGDNRYSINSALLWYGSQLAGWRQDGK